MPFEGEISRSQQENISEEEARIIEEANAAADPTTYSELALGDDATFTGTVRNRKRTRIWKTARDTFYEVDPLNKTGSFDDNGEEEVKSNFPATHQVMARLLKGLINSSDIVSAEKEGKKVFFSKELPLEKIQHPVSTEVLAVEMLLLDKIFGDDDHDFKERGSVDHNVRRDGRTAAHFDFGFSAEFFFREPKISNKTLRGYSTDEVRILREKIALFKERFAGSEGRRFIESVIKASELPMTGLFELPSELEGSSDLVGLFHEKVLSRLDALDAVARAKLEVDTEGEQLRKAA